MADFVHDSISCDFRNTLADHLTVDACLSAFKLAASPTYEVVRYIDAEGVEKVRMISNETNASSFLRSFCVIAGHSYNIVGLEKWRQPTMLSSVEDIQASAISFFRLVDSSCVQDWAMTLNATLFAPIAAVPTEEAGSGTQQDFHPPAVNASTNGS